MLDVLLGEVLKRLRFDLMSERRVEGEGTSRYIDHLEAHAAHMKAQVDGALKRNPEVRNSYLRKIAKRVARFERKFDRDYDPPRHIIEWAEIVNVARRQRADR